MAIQKFFPKHKLRIDILTIFIVLLAASSLATIFFSYYKNRGEIEDFATASIQKINKTVIAKIDHFSRDLSTLVGATRPLITSEEAVSLQNSILVDYLVNILKITQFIDQIKIATPSGNFLSVIDAASVDKPVPHGTKYVVRAIHRSDSTSQEIWEYQDSNSNLIQQETIPQAYYDHRADLWYTRVVNWPHDDWLEKYEGVSETIPVISLSIPVRRPDGTILAVINGNLSIEVLANFITHQHVGLNIKGGVFVLDSIGDIIIPTLVSQNTSLINFSTVAAAYQEFQTKKKKGFLFEENRIEYLAYFSDFPIPLPNTWSVATVVDFEDFFASALKVQRQTILISCLILVIAGVFVYVSAKHISIPIEKLARRVDAIQALDFEKGERVHSHIEEIDKLDASIAAMALTLRSFTRYVPKEIVLTLIKQGKEIALGGEKREVTVLFSDIESFTSISESLSVETLMPMLARYFDLLSKIILESNGTIDKFIGDSIMAFWNAPQIVPDHIDKASYASLRCRAALKIFNQQQSERGLPQFRTRFGIHMGDVIVGNIGTTERMNYTAIGDAVNTASRLQAINKTYATSILISETVREKLGKNFVTRPLDFIAVRGRMRRVTIYELVGVLEGEKELLARQDEIDLCKEFNLAYTAFHEGKTDEAKALFLSLSKKFPTDVPTQNYLARLNLT